jgi:hypothetical protein
MRLFEGGGAARGEPIMSTKKRAKPKVTKKKLAPRVRAAAPRRKTTAEPSAIPTAAEIAAFVGVKLGSALRPKAVQQLLKPVPGYRAVIDNVAAYLDEDNDVLKLKYDETEIMSRLANAKDLSARANVLQTVWVGVDADRQVEDSYLMKVLLDAVKRVREQSGAHPELLVKWAEVLEFVKKYRPGRSPVAAPSDPTDVNTTARKA